MLLLFIFSTKPKILRALASKNPYVKSISVLSCLLKDHYQSLGVSRNATQADIKAAYYKLSMLYHPDRNETNEAAETFRAITEAYEVIGNYKLRKMYDKGLLGNLAPEEGTNRTYTNYNPSSSRFKNKPTHHGRSKAYNFDEWSKFHYGDLFNKRYEARMRYEEKMGDNTRKGEAKNENVVYAMFCLTILAFILSYNLRESLDDPKRIVNKKP